jgi:hypothetical protein
MFLLYHSEGYDIYWKWLSWALYQRLVYYTCSGVLDHRSVARLHDRVELCRFLTAKICRRPSVWTHKKKNNSGIAAEKLDILACADVHNGEW